MGGGKQKKQAKQNRKPITRAGKAIKRMGGSIRLAREAKTEANGYAGDRADTPTA